MKKEKINIHKTKANAYVYRITNLINGKIYIGKTINPKKRKNEHFSNKDQNADHLLLKKAMKKYGKEHFKFEIIGEYSDEIIALDMEKYFIREFNASGRVNGYNLTFGGEGLSGFKHSEKTKEILRIKNIGNLNPLYGKPQSTSLRAKQSHIQSNRKWKTNHSNESKLKLSIISKSVKLNFHSDDLKNEIIELYNSGKFTKNQLAEKFNIKYHTVVSLLRPKKTKINNKKIIDKSIVEQVLNMRFEKISYLEIQTKLNISKNTVLHIIRKNNKENGIRKNFPKHLEKNVKYFDDTKINVFKDYTSNLYTNKEIIAKYKISEFTLKKIIREFKDNENSTNITAISK